MSSTLGLLSHWSNKFACPYKGPYQVLQLYDNGAQVKLVSNPNSQSIRVALNRVRLCPTEITDKEGSGSSELSEEGSPPARTGSEAFPVFLAGVYTKTLSPTCTFTVVALQS